MALWLARSLDLVQRTLTANQYVDEDAWIADMKLIVDNCNEFYKGNPHKIALAGQLQATFEDGLARMHKDLEQEQQDLATEKQRLADEQQKLAREQQSVEAPTKRKLPEAAVPLAARSVDSTAKTTQQDSAALTVTTTSPRKKKARRATETAEPKRSLRNLVSFGESKKKDPDFACILKYITSSILDRASGEHEIVLRFVKGFLSDRKLAKDIPVEFRVEHVVSDVAPLQNLLCPSF